ncbi:MAG: phosphoglucosamine mutase [Actinobacteria bacterium]|uniref:Phosphoglucosamine mutase n=1 Tax=freshwater metagenome TaxID=449393 RepID=A0A6J5ZXW9_9ZZZZ|nr:phosphoglucosamine mutase [Actinomycetota bacterium]
MARKLFGTDGVRGVAGEKLSADLALALGRAATEQAGGAGTRVLVIRDTRESGEMLEAALAAGITAAGGEALLGGVLPTPAAPLLIRQYGFDLGVVVSASHNPYQDNGIKFFGGDSLKLTDDAEEEIEARLEAGFTGNTRIGRSRTLHGTQEDYLRALETRFSDLDLSGRKLLLDCANGATYRVGPEIFRRLGAEVSTLGTEPDGRNINEGVGSTHIGSLAAAVAEGGYDLGFAFDGDGDRMLAADRSGVPVDGDELIAIAALHMRDAGRLEGNGVVVTVMTNYGFHTAMTEVGIEVASTDVGDRYVLAELRERGWVLGGEQSGHIIEMGFVPSGDGIASALLTLEALKGADLSERSAMAKLPQKLVNVPVADKAAALLAVEGPSADENAALAGRGRVLVRSSGTEELIRVMVEAPDQAECDAICARLVALVDAAA